MADYMGLEGLRTGLVPVHGVGFTDAHNSTAPAGLGEHERARLAQIFEPLETAVLRTVSTIRSAMSIKWTGWSAGTARVWTRLAPTKRRMKTLSRLPQGVKELWP